MKNIQVSASTSYTVTIASGCLQQIGSTLQQVTKAKKACIISDSHVWPLYGETVVSSLLACGIESIHFIFSAGESSKNFDNYLSILNFLAEHSIGRGDCIIALGGGVVGDLAGFVAATYLRGIPYVQVPTSLLAMVDSSVGGKTAIDLPTGKNLVGAFYPPVAVICDTNTLSTLPEEIFRDGCAEVIKYGVLYDPALFAQLEQAGRSFDREAVIAQCVQWKRDVVAQDEFDRGPRMQLNLGHTIGHAIEACSDYSISHGKAVAIGMAIVSRATACQDAQRIIELLDAFGLPTTTAFSAEQLAKQALSDKKRTDDAIQMVIPIAIGHCQLVNTPVHTLSTLIEAGL